jgi:hypothetical protein
MFSLNGLTFHLRSLLVKPGSVTDDQSDEESLWLLVKRERLLTVLRPSLILFRLEIP